MYKAYGWAILSSFNGLLCFSSSGEKVLSIAFLNAETVLHDYWGGPEYWMVRRSMRFNSFLVEVADNFRREMLNSTDAYDATERPMDWQHEIVFLILFLFNINRTVLLANFDFYIYILPGASYSQWWKLFVCPFETS